MCVSRRSHSQSAGPHAATQERQYFHFSADIEDGKPLGSMLWQVIRTPLCGVAWSSGAGRPGYQRPGAAASRTAALVWTRMLDDARLAGQPVPAPRREPTRGPRLAVPAPLRVVTSYGIVLKKTGKCQRHAGRESYLEWERRAED